MYHRFFINSSVDGHLGCFHVLAIVNSASVKTDVHVSFSVMASSGYMPSSGIGGSYSSFGASLMAQRLKHLSAMWEFNPWVGKIPWRRKWQPTPVFLPGESHGERILVGYSPRGHKESDTTEQLHIVVLPLVFKEISILSSIVSASIYIPTRNARGFPFLCTLSSIYCLQTF